MSASAQALRKPAATGRKLPEPNRTLDTAAQACDVQSVRRDVTLPDTSDASLSVDLDALAANYRTISAVAANAETAPVVKADAYGLGAGPVGRRLWAEGARSFFVARLSEGEALRTALGHDRPAAIYVLDGCRPGGAARTAAADLIPVLSSLAQVETWTAHAAGVGRRLKAALHLDTGINRLGLAEAEVQALAQASDRLRGLDLELVMSHLACADEPDSAMNAVQAERFERLASLFPGVRLSLANSGGVFLDSAYHLDLVRPGISLYGGGPFRGPDPRLQTVATLTAPILQLRNVARGETVGYGAAYLAERPMRVAIIAAGYADGVLRAASPSGYGWLEGARCGFVGRISMDLIALDVTACEALHPHAVEPDARVELFGRNIALDDAAHAAGAIAYDLLTRVGGRVSRIYTGAAA